uniref:Uncharacterized protein n=1 Tax=Clytia hemisphaerica TaxID=252671 RepID=A0A7M5UQZ8_9CNID
FRQESSRGTGDASAKLYYTNPKNLSGKRNAGVQKNKLNQVTRRGDFFQRNQLIKHNIPHQSESRSKIRDTFHTIEGDTFHKMHLRGRDYRRKDSTHWIRLSKDSTYQKMHSKDGTSKNRKDITHWIQSTEDNTPHKMQSIRNDRVNVRKDKIHWFQPIKDYTIHKRQLTNDELHAHAVQCMVDCMSACLQFENDFLLCHHPCSRDCDPRTCVNCLLK